MSVSLSMRAAEYGIRVPDSILAAYAPFNVQWVPSPSRLLSLMDPLLPTGVLAGCLAAYSGMGKSPFDDCTKNSVKYLTGKASQPVNVIDERKKTNSLLRLLKVSSKESKHRSSSYVEANSQPSIGSFHSCLSSPQSLTGNSALLSSSDALVDSQSPKHVPHCYGILSSQENSSRHSDDPKCNEQSFLDHEREYESDCTSSEHSRYPPSGKHSEESSIPSRSMSPQRYKHGKGDNTEHIAVHYHSDTEECHVVSIVERPGSPDGELLLFPLEVPCEGPYPEGGTPLDEVEVADHGEECQDTTMSMSQVCLPIAKNPYMSPLLASDEMLKTLPPIDLVVSEFCFLSLDTMNICLKSLSPGKTPNINY